MTQIAYDPCTSPDFAAIWGEGPANIEGSGTITFANPGRVCRVQPSSSANDRAELGYNNSTDNGAHTFCLFREGEHRITKLRLRPDFATVNSPKWQILCQHKQTNPSSPSGGNPVLALALTSGKWRLKGLTSATAMSGEIVLWETPAAVKLIEVRFDVTYSADPTKGKVQVTIDGKASPTFTRSTLKRGSDGKPIPSHLRVGVYRDASSTHTSSMKLMRAEVLTP